MGDTKHCISVRQVTCLHGLHDLMKLGFVLSVEVSLTSIRIHRAHLLKYVAERNAT